MMLWEKTEAYKQRQPGLSHKEAFRLVLLENPTLAEHYTGFINEGQQTPGTCKGPGAAILGKPVEN